MKTIAIYCGAATGNTKQYEDHMKKLVDWMIEENHQVVYGGGKVGLMGILADYMLEKGGRIIGVMPHFLKEREIAHSGLTQIIYANDMSERKKEMVTLGDVYLAFPGGPGTLEEIVEVISWSRLGEHRNPCILYNMDGYYEPLRQMYDKMVEEGFLSKEDRETILFSSALEEIAAFIQSYTPPTIREYKSVEK